MMQMYAEYVRCCFSKKSVDTFLKSYSEISSYYLQDLSVCSLW